jgi:hypothetical protein
MEGLYLEEANISSEAIEFEIDQLKLCGRRRHAYEMKPHPNTHLRGRPKKQL